MCTSVNKKEQKLYGHNRSRRYQKKVARINRKAIQKDLYDPDNQDGVIIHLEPDILEWEVKWVLGGITTNKPSRSDGIPTEIFQVLKDDAMKVK